MVQKENQYCSLTVSLFLWKEKEKTSSLAGSDWGYVSALRGLKWQSYLELDHLFSSKVYISLLINSII